MNRSDLPSRRRVSTSLVAGAVLVSFAAATGCVKNLAARGVAGALTNGTGESFARDDDPELVRDASAFALKTMEALLDELPRHRGLLVGAARGFTQYGYAFVETEAERVEIRDFREARAMRDRALRLYLRARDYGLRALELRSPGVADALRRTPDDALGRFDDAKHVDALFWTGAAWGAAIALGSDRPELAADTDAARALLRRALELDPGYENGSIHVTMIAIEALPAEMGGSIARARGHFEEAVRISGGRDAAPYVTLAGSVSIREQNLAEFREMLDTALAIDPDAHLPSRLANILAQRRARALLARQDDYFLEPLDADADAR